MAVLSFFAIEIFFQKQLIPLPERPFAILGAAIMFSFVKLIEALMQYHQAKRSQKALKSKEPYLPKIKVEQW
jgi:hypothetical protein